MNTRPFKQRYEALKKEVLEDKQIHEFLYQHSSVITKEMIEKGLVKLYEFSTQSKTCENCQGLDKCSNLMQGYFPKLVIEGKGIELHYEECSKKIEVDEKRKREKLIRCLYVPKDIGTATIEDFYMTDASESRIQAGEKTMNFLSEYMSDKKVKGLYIYGDFGVGKTYLLGAIANQLAEKQIPSLIVYFPDFLRELKGSIGDNTVNEKIEVVKTAPVLMLDDIGAESMTSWGRDEVLGPILQFRMLENLPTFFTSNFDFKGLKNHLTVSQKGDWEELKAGRIMERIQSLAEPIRLYGKNRRR